MSELPERNKRLSPEGGTYLPEHVLLGMAPAARNRVRVSAKSYFGEHTWDFSVECPDLPLNECRLSFDLKVSNSIVLTSGAFAGLLDSIKCLAFSLIADPPHARIGIPTIVRAFKKGHGVGNLYLFLGRNNISCLQELEEFEFGEFLTELVRAKLPGGRQLTDRSLLSRARGIEWIPLQALKLADKFTFDPWKETHSIGRWAKINADVIMAKDVLTTEPWPDSLTAALFTAALKEIDLAPQLVEDVREVKPARSQYVRLRSAVGLVT